MRVPEEAREELPPGVAAGLAWTEGGGDVIYVETALLPYGNGLTLTADLQRGASHDFLCGLVREHDGGRCSRRLGLGHDGLLRRELGKGPEPRGSRVLDGELEKDVMTVPGDDDVAVGRSGRASAAPQGVVTLGGSR